MINQHAGLLLTPHVYLHQSLAAMPVVTKTDVYAKIPTQNIERMNDMKVEAGSGFYFSSRAHLKVMRL